MPKNNQNKSDVYSTALTILHAANLKPCFRIYDKRNINIDDYIL